MIRSKEGNWPVCRPKIQQPDIDFNEILTPIGRIRLFFAIANITTAYLNGLIQEEMFIEKPEMSKLL